MESDTRFSTSGFSQNSFPLHKGPYAQSTKYKEYHMQCTVYPLVGIETLPTPLSPASVPLPPEGGGAHSPADEGLGESQFRRLEKNLALCLLCAPEYPIGAISNSTKICGDICNFVFIRC